ncbi:MAG: nuclear transport factor 2 family protein, partial [Caulobacteraceae bacterium]
PAAPPLTASDVAAMRYAADRAEIENLQARYLFALDWQDADAYASTFAPEGVLDWAGGIVTGREAIHKEVVGMRANFAKREALDAPKRPARLRHMITSVVLKVDGDRATSRSYWFEIDNNNSARFPIVSGYGHYDDELRKVDGHWLFTRRRINNEVMDSRPAGPKNPAW